MRSKEIGLVGSAQLGKSLAPRKLGIPFRDFKSDLDLFVISSPLFAKLTVDFKRWEHDVKDGKYDTTTNERRFLPNNLKQIPKNIARGFIHANRIPSFPEHPTAQKIQRTMEDLTSRLKLTEDAPKPLKASIRCYNSWNSFVQKNL